LANVIDREAAVHLAPLPISAPGLFTRFSQRTPAAFIILFALNAACQALLLTIVPQQAYQLLGTAQLVTVVYVCASMVGLAACLLIPMVLARCSRRTLVTIAVATNVLSCVLLARGRANGIIAALLLQALAAATIEIVVNLYLLDTVARRGLNRFEPLRLLFAGSSYLVGPWLGVALHHRVAEGLTFLVVALLSTIFLFQFLILTGAHHDGEKLRPANPMTAPSRHPLRSVRRFAGQPRLVLAWLLAVGRSGWWVMYFVYTPIWVAQSGYGPEAGGLLVSAGQLPMLAVRAWAALGQRYGLRRLLALGYAGCGIATLAVGTMMGWPIVAMACICLAALFATMIDGAGNVPFLRAVRPLERSEMTAVFMTFRQVGSLAPTAVYFGVLMFAPLPFVYITSGLIALAMAGLSLKLSRGL
jgi:MFS family permease